MPRDFVDQYNFRLGIKRVLKQVRPDLSIKGDTSNEINQMLHFLSQKIMSAINQLMLNNKHQTVQARDVMSAVKLVIPRELGTHAMSELTKALTKYNSVVEKNKKTHNSRSYYAGLVFPVTRIDNIMRKHMTAERLSDEAPVALSAVLEYITAEIVELSGHVTADHHKIRINTRELLLAIQADIELSTLFKDLNLSGGYLPYKRISNS